MMKLIVTLILLLGTFELNAQKLDQIVEEYIRKNNVVTVSEKDTAYYKTGKPYMKKYSSGVKSLSVPKGAIPIPMPTGTNDVRGKFYSSYVPNNVYLILYIVQLVNGKEVVTAVNGGEIVKENRARVDILLDFKEIQKATIYCYFLNGVVFGAPFIMSKNHIVRICNFKKEDFILEKDIPALLIYEEEKGSTKREKLVEKMRNGQFFLFDKQKYEDIYKQLGNYCIIYYRLTKNGEKK